MAIAAIPNNLAAQQANQQALVTWNAVSGATSYAVQRSLDGVNWSALGTATVPSYLDTTVSVGVMYYYRAASVNGSGTSGYSSSDQTVPSPAGELSLWEIRLRSKQMADRVNSQFVGVPEWNSFINRSMFELYDILITSFEDYYVAAPIHFATDGTSNSYALPNGSNTFLNSANQTVTPAPFYKLMGVDMGLNTNNNTFASMKKFNFFDRNRYFYPTSGGTVFGIFNMQYRVVGSNIELIPTPTANQRIQLWYVPRMVMLLQDIDLSTQGISGWLEYVIVRAAKYALDKEESDTSKMDAQLLFLKQRIEEAAQNRDQTMPDTITDTRSVNYYGVGGTGFTGPIGGI